MRTICRSSFFFVCVAFCLSTRGQRGFMAVCVPRSLTGTALTPQPWCAYVSDNNSTERERGKRHTRGGLQVLFEALAQRTFLCCRL